MRTILFLENGTHGGGSFESLFQLITNLDPMRFRSVVVFVNRTVFYDRIKGLGIPVFLLNDSLYSLGDKKFLTRFKVQCLIMAGRLLPSGRLVGERMLHRGAIAAVCNIIKEYRVDLIHLNNQSLRDLYGVIAASDMHVPCVSHLRSARVEVLPSCVVRFLNENVAQFVANSNFAKSYWERLGIDPDKIDVVYNAIGETKVIPMDVRRQWGIDPTVKYVIGCVGNLAEGKGQEFLIHAFQKVLKDEPSVVLLMVGDGPKRDALTELTSRLNISESILFVGYESRAKEVIAGLDLLVAPSKTETFGRTLLEAMLLGTPIVAANVGGIPELVVHGRNGLLVEYDDEKGLADAIVRVLHDPSLARQFCANGRQIAEERFDLKTHITKVQALYDRIIGSYRP